MVKNDWLRGHEMSNLFKSSVISETVRDRANSKILKCEFSPRSSRNLNVLWDTYYVPTGGGRFVLR